MFISRRQVRTSARTAGWLQFPWAPAGGRVCQLEPRPLRSGVGRWRLSVRRPEGNFTAAAGVASDLINLNAGKECATGINAKKKKKKKREFTDTYQRLSGRVSAPAGILPVWKKFCFFLFF